MTASADDYAFDNSADLAAAQLATIQAYLDPLTNARLDALDLPDGARCLELGAGGGSVAVRLAGRVHPTGGEVHAVDLDPVRVPAAEGLTVHTADIREGLPVEGPFDLIHARLLLLHLPKRREILAGLTAALAPGGHLVLGEFGAQPLRVYRAPLPGDAELFTRVTGALLDLLADHGADMEWAHRAHAALADAGLRDVRTVEHAESWTGGGEPLLYRINAQQKRDELIAAGVSAEEVDRYVALMGDPGFSAPSYRFVLVSGRR